ncbi:URC4/urg3 family protein [Phormidium tenue]|uniref:Uracil phosphoribosyltransferase n=1 Tax=Phormidium tenue NIES-30 TaxID=549789 RepID=A0A1U7J9X9_9CYAN|nr:URC4/urg3 family protein [Phormidium tenue]MBD2230655.1 URC4/urg3 family protein [Phormidium tenue FACHB-1052]OKH50584.1 uracil phosphoribosyltransferase [Phormidium tenue NIES-30]
MVTLGGGGMVGGDHPTAEAAIAYLQRPQAIRDRTRALFHLAEQDRLQHFRYHPEALPATTAYVLDVMRQQYPDGDIPFHSRWRHFEVAGRSRLDLLEPELSRLDPVERTKLKVDLAITSVLLDAGAGNRWRYVEPGTGLGFARSEGLAIASFHSFTAGLFSSQPDHPWQADAHGLTQLTANRLVEAFQVHDNNPLLGLEGRVALLQKLGHALHQQPQFFGPDLPRPGNLVNYWLQTASHSQLSATTILQTILLGLGPIWPGRVELAGINLGDVWPHPQLPDTGPGSNLVPFHKLSQWLTYSLLEPLQDLGLTITNLDQLTGLAEYRNGGLFMDCGVLSLKDPAAAETAHTPGSPLIVEWRALTLCLLDDLATHLRQSLSLDAETLPLVKVLQGGTWTAGRQIAGERRAGGGPPIQLASDGTVF